MLLASTSTMISTAQTITTSHSMERLRALVSLTLAAEALGLATEEFSSILLEENLTPRCARRMCATAPSGGPLAQYKRGCTCPNIDLSSARQCGNVRGDTFSMSKAAELALQDHFQDQSLIHFSGRISWHRKTKIPIRPIRKPSPLRPTKSPIKSKGKRQKSKK
jgi:hypothetical protein